MLELLQEVCSSSEGEVCLSADSLGRMERLPPLKALSKL
ncbi:hypothetical protein PR003_g16684 [Phytophthora rubi]|uniref:Uncharacterized protein n=1 Tax=Phytophthora rubi TaxID=129364 RepID=A0A6A4EL83_9STRA|nr:hypothetical protein PR003_g16684 [Phytophthora rubi]